jgi:hypothetical protein
MKNVHIIETKTGKVKAIIPVDLTGLNYTPTLQEYEAAAWEAAIDDGSVDPDRYSDYSLKVEEAAQPGAQSSSPTR